MLDFMYHYIGDDITAITLLCEYYLTSNEPIPFEQAQRILLYTRDIECIVNNITMASCQRFPFPQFKSDIPLHPIIKDLITFHFGNDVYVINLIVHDAIDFLAPQPRQISIDAICKIINHANAIKAFMDKLRLATIQ
jgi:hypothetical protein